MKTKYTTTHTPGKLLFFTGTDGETSIFADEGGCTVARMGDPYLDSDCPASVNEADAERLVACWNALLGINPAAIAEAVAALELLIHLRDAAPAVTERRYAEGMIKARAALAKLKGQP